MQNREKLLTTELWKHDRVGSAERGENPTVVTRMQSGYVFMMDYQFLPGWCILTATPQVFELTSLSREKRDEFLRDMHLLGEAISDVVEPARMNYSILGNTDNYLHAHVYPRYGSEDEIQLKRPAWEYFSDPTSLSDERKFGVAHFELLEKIRTRIGKIEPAG